MAQWPGSMARVAILEIKLSRVWNPGQVSCPGEGKFQDITLPMSEHVLLHFSMKNTFLDVRAVEDGTEYSFSHSEEFWM